MISPIGHTQDSTLVTIVDLQYAYDIVAIHYYTNFTGGGRFRFSAAGKAVRRGLEATVNRGLTAVGGLARRG